jgi:hypothetical protein
MSELAPSLPEEKNTAIAHTNHRLSDGFYCLFHAPLRLTTLVLERKDGLLQKKSKNIKNRLTARIGWD